MKRILVAGLVSAVLGPTALVQGQSAYPNRTITLVVPLAPGGGVDVLARIVAEHLKQRLGQSVVVENRTGGGGIVGDDSVAKAAPDGYTLLTMNSSEVLHKWLHRSVPFDAMKDFAPIALLATSPLILMTNAGRPYKTFAEFLAYAQDHPHELTFGSPGVGSPHHLAGEMLNKMAGIDVVHVPYRGTSPALNDLVANQIPMIWATSIASLPFIETGKVIPLASADLKRPAVLPNVPTIAEHGVTGFHVEVWFGIAAPAATPAPIIARLSEELRRISQLPEVRERLQGLGFDLVYKPAATFAAMAAEDHVRYGEIIRGLGIRPE
jgi:tripartite-type tricarboxylate transporter receptor subunit TctC